MDNNDTTNGRSSSSSSSNNNTDGGGTNNGSQPQQTASGNDRTANTAAGHTHPQPKHGRRLAPIFVTPAPSAATKKASAGKHAEASGTAVRCGATSGRVESKVNGTEDEKDVGGIAEEDNAIITTARQLGRKRPPLAPLFASPRSGADGLALMMTVTPSSFSAMASTASATGGANGRKRPRADNADSGGNRGSGNNNSSLSSSKTNTSLSRSNSAVSSSSASTQLYLDLGQSNFAARSICPICGMMTVHGMAEDDAEHERICSEYRKGVAFAGWKNERVVGTFGGGGGGLNDKSRNGLGVHVNVGMGLGMSMANQQRKASTSGRIVEVRPTDPAQHRKLVRRVKAIVDQELGFADSSTSTNRSPSTMASTSSDFDFALDVEDDDEEEESSLFGKTAYLYVSNKTVVGFCTVEVIRSAHRLLESSPTADGQSSGGPHSSSNGMSNLHRSTKPTKAIMGIHQLWCHSSHRKGKVATRLVDIARSQLVYGMCVPHDMVAFSSPTMAGLTFAKRYAGTETPLVYDCH